MRAAGWVLGVVLFHSTAWGWGAEGHRVVGELAERHLCPRARTAVRQMLSSHESLADASTWADRIRGEPRYRYLAPWHYVSMAFGSEYQSQPKEPHGDVVSAIHTETNRLHSPSAQERLEGLRLLAHFVGDAHQPLHAGEEDDRGGNEFQVEWFGRRQSLHKVWDSGVIDRMNLGEAELVDELDTPSPAVPAYDPEIWVNESSSLAQTVYPRASKSKSLPRLGREYQARFESVVRDRLRAGGLRLAAVLNREMGCPD